MVRDPKTHLSRFGPKAVGVLNPEVQLVSLRYSPRGSTLAAGGFDGSVHRWDAEAGADAKAARSALKGHGGWVQALAFHPDGERLFSADSWGRLCCWPHRDEDAKPIWTVDGAHDGWVRQIAVRHDGEPLATCGADGVLRLWTADGRKRHEWADHGEDVFSVAFHPDGSSLASGDLKGRIRLRDAETGAIAKAFDASVLYRYDRIQDVGGVRVLAFDPEGTRLCAAGMTPKTGGFVQGTPTILVFDVSNGALLQTLTIGGEADGFVHDLAWHWEGFVMAVTSGQPGNGRLLFWSPGDPAPFFMKTEMANCHALAVHPGGRRLAVCATNAGSNGNGRRLDEDGEYRGNRSPIHLWDLPEPPAAGDCRPSETP